MVLGVIGILAVSVMALWSVHVKPPDITPMPSPGDPNIDGPSVFFPELEGSPDVDGGELRKEKFYTFLLAGTDKDGALTDVIMVASFDVKNMEINVINIPRDTLVDAKRSVKKINGAYGEGGVEQLMDEVASIIGFRPDRYAIVDLKGFEALVDAIGGVTFDVPRDMNYDDPTQNLSIHLKKGEQLLDGKKALQLVRYRSGYANADLGRISTTQDFLKAVAKQTLRIQNLPKIPKFAGLFFDYVKTDLENGELLWFAQQALSVDTEENINFYTLSEETANYNKLNYVVVYEKDALELVNSTVNPYSRKITNLNVIGPGADNASGSIPGSSSGATWNSGSSGGSSSSSGSAATAKPKPTPTPAPPPSESPEIDLAFLPSPSDSAPPDESSPPSNAPTNTPTAPPTNAPTAPPSNAPTVPPAAPPATSPTVPPPETTLPLNDPDSN
ncbi:LCP family protein [Oscillospiraceae bacterium OttesenSCG-928-G22]|nr:LCP family protein [Oscillospiraceae bacterium OttesenSCG-928-G22]